MLITIRALDFPLTNALQARAERRLRSALTCYNGHIQRVVMRLSGNSGARGSADKCCHLQVRLARLPDVVIEDVESDLYVAIGRASHRAGRTIRRLLSRRRDKARTTGFTQTLLIDEGAATR